MKSYLYLAFFFHGNDIFNAKGAVQEVLRFMLGVFLAVIILKPLAAGYEYDMRFAELTKKIEGISYEYDADTTDLFTAFEAEETDYIVILLVGVLLLIVVLPVKEDKRPVVIHKRKLKPKSVSESTCDDEEYEKLLEKKLEGILEG